MNMMLLLSATEPDPKAMMNFLQIVTYLAVLGATVKVLFTKKPGLAELATKKELEGYVSNVRFNEFRLEARGDVQEIKAMIGESTKKVEEYAEKSYQSRQRIHTHVNKIDKELTKVETRQDEQGKQITELQRHG